MSWTDDEIVMWGGEPVGGGSNLGGGAAYRPATDEWRELSPSPLPPSGELGWVWTGKELVMWTSSGAAAAWQPNDNTWRTIDDWPLRGSFWRRAAWTGSHILDVDRGLLVDPATGDSQPIAEPPGFHQRASVVWADGYVVSVTGGAYGLATDRWVDMPASGLTPLATAGSWVGIEVVAVDYEMRAAGYNPDTNTWVRYPRVPLRFYECSPRVHTVADQPIAELCSGIGLWDSDRHAWTPIAYPGLHKNLGLIAADDELFAWGDGFYQLAAGSFTDPRRLAVGTSFLDLPRGWSFQTTAGEAVIEVHIASDTGDTCTISAVNGDATGVLRSYFTEGTEVVELTPDVGGDPVVALQNTSGQLDKMHHLTWATGTTDVIDVACTNAESAHLIAKNTWSPYQ